jgi:hypothetical protein
MLMTTPHESRLGWSPIPPWTTHLHYLRDLQRVGREVLAEAVSRDETGDVSPCRLQRSGSTDSSARVAGGV